MYKSRSRKTRVSTKNPEKNQRNRSHKATRKQSAAGNNALKGNRGTPIRNESEPSSTYFLAESSDKDISAQYLRPNIHPIYHLPCGPVALPGLLLKERIDVRIAPIRIRPLRIDERLDAGRCIPRGPRACDEQVAQLPVTPGG